MIVIFDPLIIGIFIFGMIGGICPCSCAMNRGLIGYLASKKMDISHITILGLIGAYFAGTIVMLLPLGIMTGLLGGYVVSWNSRVAFVLGSVVMFAMGLQLLRFYRLPLKSIFKALKQPESYSIFGAFRLGLSFGLMTVGRGAPMLVIILTYIALFQAPLQGLVSIFDYALGFSIMLFAAGSIYVSYDEKARFMIQASGETIGQIVGALSLPVGIYFLYLALV